jgi:hypothetical protein
LNRKANEENEDQDYKNKTQQNGGSYSNSQNGSYCTCCRRSDQLKRNHFKSKNKTSRNNSTLSDHGNNGNHDRRNFDFSDVAFNKTTKPMKPANDTWIS